MRIDPKVSSALLNTIQIGTQLFNPHRFYPVLKTLHSVPAFHVEDNLMEKYFEAASVCFGRKNSGNIRLVGLGPMIRSLQLLANLYPSETQLRNAIFTSVIESIDTEQSLVEAVKVAEETEFFNTEFWDHIRSKLDTVENIHSRIALVHLVRNPREFTGFISDLKNLSELELSTLLKFAPNVSPILRDTLEVRIDQLVKKSGTSMEKKHALEIVLKVGIENPNFPVSQYISGPLSPSNSVDWFYISGKGVDDIVWRLERDPEWFKHLTPAHVIRMMNGVVKHDLGGRCKKVIIEGLGSAIARQKFPPISLGEIMKSFTPIGWLEFESVSILIFQKPIVGTTQDVLHVLKILIEQIEISDLDLIKQFVKDRSDRNEIMISLTENLASQQSGLVQLLFAKTLMGKRNIDHIIASIESSNRISFQARMGDLSMNELVEIASQVERKHVETSDGKNLLANMEMVNEALIGGDMNLLNIFVKTRFPSPKLVSLLGKKINTMTQFEFLSFMHAAGLIRCVPSNMESICDYMSTRDWRVLSCAEFATLIESLSSLGLLSPKSSIIDDFFQCADYNTVSLKERAGASSKILSSLYIALIVPNDRNLKSLKSNIKDHEIDAFDQSIITQFETLSFGDIKTVETLPYYFSHPKELTAIEKFKRYIRKGIR